MKRALDRLRLLVAAMVVTVGVTTIARGDYLTFDIVSHEAMADYVRFESRSWAEDAEGEGGRLASNTVWSGGEHVVLYDLYIPSGVTLTINAGTVVKFREGTRIKVEDGGSLVINGANGNEVVLEGYDDATVFKGIVLQSSAASYSDNGLVIVRGFNFGRYATVSLNNTTAFQGGGQALVPVDVSGSRDTAFSFDWVAETNGVTFASGTMSWNSVSEGRKNITVPYPDGLPGCSNFVIRAVTFRCCSPNVRECVVTLSEFITTDIFSHEAMADYIAFESREWVADVLDAATNSQTIAVECGRLQSNTTWGPDATHLILSDVYIPSGVTLTLTADTVVEFCEGTRIKIEDGGTLNIVGADGHDVILRGAEGVANFGGIVKMPNGTFADNTYFRFEGFTYGALANVALHDSSTFRSSGLALIPVTVSGSRSTAFSVDWVAETNGAPYKTGTLKWNNVSEGTKNISINYGAELDGYTNFALSAAVDRACKTSPNTCTIKISDFVVSDIASHESRADYIRFESRDWAADLEGEGGRLAANATWEGTHKIASDVYIPSGVMLTLAADAVVEFYEGTRIKIEDGGTLNIVGANGHDVIIRGAEGVTNYVGIVKMPNGTYTDNMYVQYTDRPYPAYPYITVHEATTYREAGKMWIAFSLSGSLRNQSFNVDWSTDKGDSGTLTWSSSSDGTKWIEIPVDSELVGGTTNHVINLTAARGCNISVGKSVLTVLEPDYNVKGQVALAESDTHSNEFAVNGGIKTQPLFLNDVETVQYSGKWQPYDENEAAVLRVTLETDNGATVLKEASPSETGAFDLNLKQYPVGYYTLKQEILNDLGETLATMQKTFSIADEEDVELHGGTLKQNEVWSADKVHVVYETVVVPSIYTIFIEPGAIVKFMTGTGIDISQGGAFFANRIVFTHINDDTVGGDTLNDGFTVAPPMDAYYLAGAFTFGDDTELRGITQNNALTGTIATHKTLSRGSTYRVSGTLTVASGGSLTIPAGTVLKMEAGAKIEVSAGGSLISKGTRASPIVMTSIKDDSYSGDTNGDGSNSRPAGGDWQGIWVSGKADFEYTTMMYAGKGNERGIVETRNSGVLTLNNCIVAHAEYDGIWNWGGAIAATNTVVMNTGYATAPYRGSLNEYVNCVFYGNNVGMCYWSHWTGKPTYSNCIFNECSLGWCELGGSSHGDPPSSIDVANCVFWNPEGYGLQSCGRVGSSGNIWGDPLFVDSANGDFRVMEGSPCVDAADSAAAPEYDYYGQPRITIADHGDELVGQLADIGICEVMPRDVVSDIDLVPQSVRTTTNAVPGQLLFVKWEVANTGGREVESAWRDTVSLVSETGREVVLGDKTTSNRIGVGGSVFCSGYFTVPAIAEGTWYPKVNVNSYHDIFEGSLSSNNALTGERAVSVGLEALDPSVAREGIINGGTPTVLKLAFGENDDNRMVKLNVPAGVNVTWGFGFMPQGTSKSGGSTAAYDGVMFRVPDDATEVYVVLASDTTTAYNLSTEATRMTIASVSPASLPSSGTTTLTITGAGFGEDCEVTLANAGESIQLQSNTVDAGQLSVAVDCARLKAGNNYDVVVLSGDGEVALTGAVTVTKAEGKGHFWAQANIPDSMREGRIATFAIDFGNSGNANCDAQVIVLKCNRPGALRKAGSEQWLHTLYLVATGESQAGVLTPGEAGKVFVQYRATSDNKISVYSSSQDTFDPSPWGTRQDFLFAVRSSIERLAAINADYGEWTAVYNTAIGMHNGSLSMVGGRVVDERGEGVSNVPVLLQPKGGDNVSLFGSYTAVSDGIGSFSFAAIPPGRYAVCTGAAYPHARIAGEVIDADNCVMLDGGEVIQGISVVVPNGVGMRIYLDGEPEDCRGTACVTASLDGLFGTNSIPALYDYSMGNYFVPSVTTDVFWHVEARSGDLLAEKTVFLAGEDMIDVEMSLKPTLHLMGIVKDFSESRIPEDDAYVIARMLSGSHRYIAEVSSNGVFSLSGLPAGRYCLSLSGLRCSYEINSEYDFSDGGTEMLELRPIEEDHELTVKYPTSWVGNRFVVIRNYLGIENAKSLDFCGEIKFNRVEDGLWACIVIDANGNEVDSLEAEVVDGNGLVDFSTRRTLMASAEHSQRTLLGGWWGDVTDAIYGYWKVFRDKAADWLAGWKWADTVIGWFQNGEYLKGRDAEEEALRVMAAYQVQTPPDCFCGYNQRKRAADGESVQNFAKVYRDFATFLSKCDNMKAVAMSFKTVGDTAETAMKYYMKKNAGGIVASLGEKWPKIGNSIKATKGWMKNHKTISAVSVYGSLTGQAIYDLIDSFDADEIDSYFSDAIRSATVEGDMTSAISALLKASKYLSRYAKKDVKDALKNTAPEIAEFFDSISEVLDIIVDVGQLLEDAVVTYQEWHQYENALSDFTTMYNWFISEIGRYRSIAENFNKYHGDECYQACPVLPDPPIEVYVPNVPRSYDPNEMSGPIGLGDPETERFVKPGEELTYTIYFENKTNATAAAQEVYVTNPLNEWLDWSTFKMHEVAFGDQIDLGLADKSSGTSEVTMKGTNFVVRTELVLEENGDACPYQARWYMRIVDPTTDTGWPTDIVAGFLPPNDETHRGEGHITYSICVRADAPANLVISNSADIVFDHNPSIKTDPAWWNTVTPDVGEVKFAEDMLDIDEGSNLVVRVAGGDAYTNSSVKVYLTYQTASAADVDLANGSVADGNLEQSTAIGSGIKFPLTLKWAAGEIGEKVITIPVKADALYEGDEMLTLQLVGATGQEMGENTICTVTIKDAQEGEDPAGFLPAGATPVYQTAEDGETQLLVGYFTKADKKGNVTAKAMPGYVFVAWVYNSNGKTYSTKATITDKLRKSKKVHPLFAPAAYLRALSGEPAGGTVKGQGMYAMGKTVSLTATPKKGYAFTGWRTGNGESETGDGVLSLATTYKYTVADDGSTVVASFKKESELARPVITLADSTGSTSSDAASGNDRTLSVGVSYPATLSVAAESKVSITKVTGLPTGLTYKSGKISGVPTKAGKFTASVTVTLASNKKKTWVCKVPFTVAALPEWVRGAFTGEVESPDSGEVAAATMSVASNGKISGKFVLGGTNWTFSASSFAKDSVVTGEVVRFSAAMNATGTWKVYDKKTKKYATKSVKLPFGFALVADPETSEIASVTEGGYFGATVFEGEPPVLVSEPGAVEFRRDAGVRVTKGGATAGGSVSLSVALGQAASGKTVKATAKLAKGYALLGWYSADDELLGQALTYIVKMDGSDVFLVAKFKKEGELAKPVLSWGGEVWPDVTETNLTVGVAYSAALSVEGEAKASVTKVTGLPTGLAWKGGKISGVPTKAGKFTVTVTAALSTNAKKTWTYKQALAVSALPAYAKGSFTGAATVDNYYVVGLAAVSVGSTGAISGKFFDNGTNWTFSAASYTGTEDGVFVCSNLVASYSWKSGKTTKKATRPFVLHVDQLAIEDGNADSAVLGHALLEEIVPEEGPEPVDVVAWQNLWGSKYKAIGEALFRVNAKTAYRTWSSVEAMGLGEYDKLSVKVTTAGAVTATLKHFKGTFDAKTKKPQYATYTCTTTLIPLTAPEAGAEAFNGGVPVFFPATGYFTQVEFPFSGRDVPVPTQE